MKKLNRIIGAGLLSAVAALPVQAMASEELGGYEVSEYLFAFEEAGTNYFVANAAKTYSSLEVLGINSMLEESQREGVWHQINEFEAFCNLCPVTESIDSISDGNKNGIQAQSITEEGELLAETMVSSEDCQATKKLLKVMAEQSIAQGNNVHCTYVGVGGDER